MIKKYVVVDLDGNYATQGKVGHISHYLDIDTSQIRKASISGGILHRMYRVYEGEVEPLTHQVVKHKETEMEETIRLLKQHGNTNLKRNKELIYEQLQQEGYRMAKQVYPDDWIITWLDWEGTYERF